MIGRGDFWLAIAAAAGLHVAALTLWPLGPDGGGSGAEGAATISVAAADPALQAIVESWINPPDAAAVPDAPSAPLASDAPARPRDEVRAPLSPLSPPLPVPTRPGDAPLRAEAPDRVSPPRDTADRPLATRMSDAPAMSRNARPIDVALTPPPLPSEKIDTAPPETPNAIKARRPDPRPSRPAVEERRAAGTGGGTSVGRAVSNAARAASDEERAAAQARWAADIQRRIARHQAYPRGARDTGRVKVTMVILRNGSLGEVTVARSSGADLLDRAALRAVERAAPFPPAPEALTDRWYRVAQWISFERR